MSGSDFSRRVTASSGRPAQSSLMTGYGNLDGSDQITVVRIDDTHIAEQQSHPEVEYIIPTEEEEVVGDGEDDGVYVIEYSNPEEESDSYQVTMSIDKSIQAKRTTVKRPVDREDVRARPPVKKKVSAVSRPRQKTKRRRGRPKKEVKGQGVRSKSKSKSVQKLLVCKLCQPPVKFFRRAASLAFHLKYTHFVVGNKPYKQPVCTSCKQTLRSQDELTAHTRRHAREGAIFTCPLCATATGVKTEAETSGFKGSKYGLRLHLQKEHPGIIPECDICNRGFKTLQSYLADQFRHVGVSPFFCSICQIYLMAEKSLTVHIRNHEKKQEEKESPPPETHQLTAGVSASTDDSDL